MRNLPIRVLAVTTALSCVVALSGCNNRKDEDPPSLSPVASSQSSTSSSSETVDFGLESPPSTNFGDIDSTVSQTDPGIYTIIGGYAYALDPNTFEPIGPPLDPITHMPVELPAEDEPEPEAEPEPELTKPTETNKLPNTGIFLEDD